MKFLEKRNLVNKMVHSEVEFETFEAARDWMNDQFLNTPTITLMGAASFETHESPNVKKLTIKNKRGLVLLQLKMIK